MIQYVTMHTDKNNQPGQTDQFTGPHQFQMESWISCAPFERLLHITIVEAADGRATLTMPFLVDFAQGAGLMHGGALIALADTAVVMAIKSLLQPETHFATISLEAKYLHPVKQGVVKAVARVSSRRGRILYGKAIVYDKAERPVLEFSSKFKVARDARIKNIIFKNGSEPSVANSSRIRLAVKDNLDNDTIDT